jgi:catechol 2,3-dioxygenase-like lactoylglutathione lyase family enzyme
MSMPTQSASAASANERPIATIETKLEIVVLPVSDVDRAKRFYERLGWRLDADFASGDSWRVVQVTPHGSACSVLFGKGLTTAQPGSVQGNFRVVDDVVAARAELLGFGADVSEVFHFAGGLQVVGTERRRPGPDPERKSYSSFASFRDPDGNGWLLQEITARLPGRRFGSDATTLTELLREAEKRHGDYAPTAPPQHWSEWYAGYIVARQRGKTADGAVKDAALHVQSVHR